MFGPETDFSGKVAVITGGASGIGLAVARRLIAEQVQVMIADVEQAALDRATAETGAIGMRINVSSAESMQALADEARRRFGGVDLFCSNAGVASSGPIAAMTGADWEWLLGVNVWGLIHGIRAFLPLMRGRPGGAHLAVTASEAGFHVTPQIAGYCVTKATAVAIAEGLSAELKDEGADIGVTILCPGPVSTRLGGSQRNRPSALSDGALIYRNLEATEEGQKLRWIAADTVADTLMRAIRKQQLYAFTHPEMAGPVEERHRAIAKAISLAEVEKAG
jgi:NAD(P)-dependent dehydrogenase (short-subunit alcohol dehydrogenase family)